MPFCSLLNGIKAAFKSISIANERYYHDSLSFFVYDRPMKGVDNAASLKPSGVGTYTEKPGNSERIHWYVAELAIEIKNSWPHMITQSAIYARCLFAACESRGFVLVIAFNNRTSEVWFSFYHRGGLTSTSASKLREAVGFRTVVRTAVGVSMWPDASAAGMDIFVTTAISSFLMQDDTASTASSATGIVFVTIRWLDESLRIMIPQKMRFGFQKSLKG